MEIPTFKDALGNTIGTGNYIVYLDINSNFTPKLCVGQVIDQRFPGLYCKSWSKEQAEKTKDTLNTGRKRNVYLFNGETIFLVAPENVSERIKRDLDGPIPTGWW